MRRSVRTSPGSREDDDDDDDDGDGGGGAGVRGRRNHIAPPQLHIGRRNGFAPLAILSLVSHPVFPARRMLIS